MPQYELLAVNLEKLPIQVEIKKRLKSDKPSLWWMQTVAIKLFKCSFKAIYIDL